MRLRMVGFLVCDETPGAGFETQGRPRPEIGSNETEPDGE
jgi:hypothetical protein